MPTASVHGRFQIFHLDHLRYVSMAMARYGEALIGITGIPALMPTRHMGPSHRHHALDNPFSYAERVEMITAALTASGIDRRRFSFAPFPIESPELLPYFVGREVICATTIREAWNLEKAALLETHGYKVEVLLHDATKTIAGSSIRRMILAGDEAWRKLVPPGTEQFIDEKQIALRLRDLSQMQCS